VTGGAPPHPRRGPAHRRQHRQAAGAAGGVSAFPANQQSAQDGVRLCPGNGMRPSYSCTAVTADRSVQLRGPAAA
jgi:hypothetical protein